MRAGIGLRDSPRGASARAADPSLQAIGLSAIDPLRSRPRAGLFDRHRADVCRRRRHRALRRLASGRACPSGPGSSFRTRGGVRGRRSATAPILLWRFNVVAAGAWLTAPLAIPLPGGMIALGAVIARSSSPSVALRGRSSTSSPWVRARWSGSPSGRPASRSCGRRRLCRRSSGSPRSRPPGSSLRGGCGPRPSCARRSSFSSSPFGPGPAGRRAASARGPRRRAGGCPAAALAPARRPRGRGRPVRSGARATSDERACFRSFSTGA